MNFDTAVATTATTEKAATEARKNATASAVYSE